MLIRPERPRRQPPTTGEFRQMVRRYRPSILLPALARLSIAMNEEPSDKEMIRQVQPWAIPYIARESILYGNEHRQETIDARELFQLFRAFSNIHDGQLDVADFGLLAMMLQITFEQFPYQESMFEETTRTILMFVEGSEDLDLKVLSPDAWRELLGDSLLDVINAMFVLDAGVRSGSGYFRRSFLDLPDAEPLFDLCSRETIERTLNRLTHTPETFRAAYEAAPFPSIGDGRYAFNPLVERPFIELPGSDPLAPQPALIARTIAPGSLYYAGVAKWGEDFTEDLGKLAERYVGRQLVTIEGAPTPVPEIIYGKPERKSIDWFLILDKLVVMFEVKSSRFGLLDKAGDTHQQRLDRTLGKAFAQVNATNAAIDSGIAEFAVIPADRRRMAIVLTAEPFYLANTDWTRELLPDADVPTLIASFRELEDLCCLTSAEIEDVLIRTIDDGDRSMWHLGQSIRHEPHEDARNRLQDEAWDRHLGAGFLAGIGVLVGEPPAT